TRGVSDVLQVDSRIRRCSIEGRAQCNLLKVAAGYIDLTRELAESRIVELMRFIGEALTPDLLASVDIGSGKIHDEGKAAQKSRIEVLPHVRCENRKSLVRFHSLQQVCDLDVCIPVVRILDLAALTEQSVGFVDKNCGARSLSIVEHAIDILFGVTDVFAD